MGVTKTILLTPTTHRSIMTRAATYRLLEYTDRNGASFKAKAGCEHQLEIEAFPFDNRQGKGFYTIANKVRSSFEFRPSNTGPTFDAQQEEFVIHGKFVLAPVRGAGGDIIGFHMTYPHLPKFLGKFGSTAAPEGATRRRWTVAVANVRAHKKERDQRTRRAPRRRRDSSFGQWQDRFSSRSRRNSARSATRLV